MTEYLVSLEDVLRVLREFSDEDGDVVEGRGIISKIEDLKRWIYVEGLK